MHACASGNPWLPSARPTASWRPELFIAEPEPGTVITPMGIGRASTRLRVRSCSVRREKSTVNTGRVNTSVGTCATQIPLSTRRRRRTFPMSFLRLLSALSTERWQTSR
ncbi:hypothetical protein MTO96_025754 [Rhipicephalus appendiculatus]